MVHRYVSSLIYDWQGLWIIIFFSTTGSPQRRNAPYRVPENMRFSNMFSARVSQFEFWVIMGWIVVLHCHINCLQHNINAKGIKPAIKSNRTSTLKEILRNLESPARNPSNHVTTTFVSRSRRNESERSPRSYAFTFNSKPLLDSAIPGG